jgi:acetyl esterase/lipase
LALAAGFVLITPGNRGRGIVSADGKFLGKAPTTIVDLKAAVRYLHFNKGILPGNTERIVSNGLSAGGAMSALLGASGNSHLYDEYFKEIGAAEARDDVFASAVFCPMCDLDHADMAYEWMYGKYPNGFTGEGVDQRLSFKLASGFPAYQASLGFNRRDNNAPLTADNYPEYLAKEYLIPSANSFLMAMNESERSEYLEKNDWLNWNGSTTNFTLTDLHTQTGRLKGLPAFDSFNLQAECSIFGDDTQEASHFTQFSIDESGFGGTVSEYVKKQIALMNPMPFILANHDGCADHWWIRLGTRDNGMSFSVAGNLAAGLEKNGKNVSLKFYWDGRHYVDLDPEDFVEWINNISK